MFPVSFPGATDFDGYRGTICRIVENWGAGETPGRAAARYGDPAGGDERGPVADCLRVLHETTPEALLAQVHLGSAGSLPDALRNAATVRVAADLALLGVRPVDPPILEQQRLLAAHAADWLPERAGDELARLYGLPASGDAAHRPDVRSFYDEDGDLYNRVRPATSDDMLALTLFERVLEPGDRVLDAGCGAGEPVGIRLAERCRWHGTDISAGQLSRMPSALRSLPRAAADILRLPFRDAAFDAAIAYYVLEHLQRALVPAALQELARVVVPGGWLFLSLDVQDAPGGYVPYYGRSMWFSSYDAATSLRLVEANGIEVAWRHVIGCGTASRLIVLGRRPRENPIPATGAGPAAGERIVLDRRHFPCRSEAEDATKALYRDKLPVLEAAGGQTWRFVMADSLAVRRPRDPDLAAALREGFGTEPAQASKVRFRRPGFGTSALVGLQHCWALEAWSRWLAGRPAGRRTATILHLDSHADLQAPAVRRLGQGFVFEALAGGARMDLRDPPSVARMIERGAIGIGGFVLPLLAVLDEARFIHVAPRLGTPSGMSVRRMRVAEDAASGAPVLDADDSGGIEVVATDDLAAAAGRLGEGPLLLDIDLDYFDDRFDDLPGEKTVLPDDRLREAVLGTRAQLLGLLEAGTPDMVTVATSPEFFPARLAAAALGWLLDGQPASGGDGLR